MTYWNYTAGILCLILAGYLLYTAYTRRNKKQKHLRALASLLAVASLYMIYLSETAKETEPAAVNSEIILLTEGASLDTLNRLLTSRTSARVYTLDPSLADAARNVTLVSQVNEIPGLDMAIVDSNSSGSQPGSEKSIVNNIHIIGEGLEENELLATGKASLHFYPRAINSLFTSVNWKRQLYTGEKLVIQGSFKNDNNKNLSLILQGFNTRLDSVRLSADSLQGFRLETVPKVNGRAVYSLLLMDGKDTVQQERIPFETITSSPLKILMLASSPDFENKFLKNWLFSKNYGVAIRTTISRNKFNTEYLNLSGVRTERINNNLLANFDLVIGDATALQKLSAVEMNSLKSAVQEQGIGLIIKTDSITPASLFYNAPFRYSQSASQNNQVLHLQQTDTSSAIPVLTATRPIFITNPERLRPLIRDKEGHIFSATTVWGNGKLLSTTLANTYNWVLAGDTLAYREVWSDLITEAAKKNKMARLYEIHPLIPVIDQPVMITAESSDSLPPVVRVNRSLVPVNQHFNVPFQWTGTYWPRKSGWQTILSGDNQPFYWYCFGRNDWKDLRASKKIKLNKTRASLTTSAQQSTGEDVAGTLDRNAAIYLFIMFMICCSYLWIEEKFHNSR